MESVGLTISVLQATLNIKLLEPLAQGASRFEKLLAPQKIHWPQIFSNDVSPSKTVVDIKHWNNYSLKQNILNVEVFCAALVN